MMPNNTLSSSLVNGDFFYPDNIGTNPLEDFEMGGVALQDPSQGLKVKPWKCHWNANRKEVYLTPENEDPILIGNEENVVELSFTFDQNMKWLLSILDTTGSLRFYWFDSTTQSYKINTYSGVRSSKLTLDDKRSKSVSLDMSDVILSYIKANGDLVTRVQRDRYLIEYVQMSNIPEGHRIMNFGMTSKYRLQWRILSI